MSTFKSLSKEPKKEDDSVALHMVFGLSIGMSIGIAIGAALGSIGLGISLGMCFGISIGISIGTYKREQKTQANISIERRRFPRNR